MCAQSFSASVPWPDSLEKIRIDDNSLAAAYDATPAPWRAALKCGLAMTHMHFGTSPGRMKTARHDPHLGFWQQENSEDNTQRLSRLRRNLRIARQSELTARQQQMLELYFDQGLTMAKIARELNVHRSTVSRTLQRARERLREHLQYSL